MPDAYPPDRHTMALLGIEIERFEDGALQGWLPVQPGWAGPSGGPRAGAVAMLVDALGGARSVAAAAPDWSVTADLSVHLLAAPPEVEALRAGIEVRRRGRRTLVLELELDDGGTTPLGAATITFSVIPRPEGLADVRPGTEPGRFRLGGTGPDAALTTSWLDDMGLVVEAPGVAVVDLTPRTANPVGAVHGGVLAALVDEAAATAGAAALGRPGETTDLHLGFLELGRQGPVRATATVVDPGVAGDRVTVVIDVVDAAGARCSHATAVVVAA